MVRNVILLMSLSLFLFLGEPTLTGQPTEDHLNIATNSAGVLPTGADGEELNLDFERGTIDDWTAAGEAFGRQPIDGPIDPNRPFGQDKISEHTGRFWIGGYEHLRDTPTGTLTSAPFVVDQPWASMLVGGGNHWETRIELVRADDDFVFYRVSGVNSETLRPAVIDLRPMQGKQIFVRIIDEHSGGWGHVNFDDFRLHSERPEFRHDELQARRDVQLADVFPHAGLDPQAAAREMQVPPGFSVQLGAAEPDVQQPIAMAIDDRGRVWVAEAFEYPIRAEEGKGRDRILIFEDTDLNGSLDKRTVFAENLNLVSGLEVGFSGVFVGAAPYLLFIPDRDGDDVPDSEPEVLLDGWGYQDTHETLNGFIWGPDGWLYGCHGVFTHSNVGKPGASDDERVRLNAGIWRYHPVKGDFELFAEGTSNPWGVDFDDHGQAFATVCVIPHLFHIVQGARYHRQAGTHFNPHTYADIPTIARHRHFVGNQWNDNDRKQSDELGGGHAHAGAMIYLGGSWPAEYRNQIFMHNIHGARVNMDRLERSGSGYIGDRAPDFLLTGDEWSQMINLRYGPDGQVWMIDWYDANQCHHRDPNGHDRSNGRIYRVTYQNAPPVQVDLGMASEEELIEYLGHENDWYARHARRELQELASTRRLSDFVRPKLETNLFANGPANRRLRYLWALHVTGGIPAAIADRLYADPEPIMRAWTIQLRLEGREDELSDSERSQLIELARHDASPVVRLYLASAAGRIPLSQRWSLLEALVANSQDQGDHNLPLMYWYAAEPLAEADPQRALAFAIAAGDTQPLIRDFMVRRIGSRDPGQSLALLVEGLADAGDDETRLTFLRGLNQSVAGRRGLELPSLWADLKDDLMQSADTEVAVRATGLASAFGDSAAAKQLLSVVQRKDLDSLNRQLGLRLLAENAQGDMGADTAVLLADQTLRQTTLDFLTALAGEATPQVIAEVYADLTPAQKRQVIGTLGSRVDFANELLRFIDDQTIPAGDLSAGVVRQIQNLDDTALLVQLESVWGKVGETSADVVSRMESMKELINSHSPALADVELGRAVFARTCQQCHVLFGQGGKVGPDLTGSNRADLDYLLSNILDPSAVMAKEYQASLVVTVDGRVLTGIVKPQAGGRVQVIMENSVETLTEEDIEEIQVSEQSMMPNDLLGALSDAEIVSLVKYVGGRGQVPMRAQTDNVGRFFNGTDLSGWVGNQELWSVEDGEIVGRSEGLDRNEFLVNELSAGDFMFRCEVKLSPNGGNSGIQFRSTPLGDGSVRGYQADIGAGWWGKLYEEHGRGLLVSEGGESFVNVNDWNEYQIVAVGSRIRTWINGNLCVDLNDPAGADRGIIALQLHSGGPMEIRARNFELVLLEDPNKATELHRSAALQDGESIQFEKTQLDTKFRSEGVAVGDFNNDGHLDIAAGSVWYEAPHWDMHPIKENPEEFNPKGYSNTFCNFVDDINGDGWSDLIVVDFPGEPTRWFENPGDVDQPWTAHEMVPETNNESPQYRDVDGDGQRELIFATGAKQMSLGVRQSHADAAWKSIPVSMAGAPGTDRFSHGLGVGDINGDDRLDVLVTQGWWEAPEENSSEPWKFHQAPFGGACADMYAFDVDGDGDQDVFSSSAHNYGIWWHEQTDDGWTTHEIDRSFSQSHSLCLADVNGDGKPDLITGKRFWAHNGSDPGGNDDAVICWFELGSEDGRPLWTKHQIDHDSGVGTQFEVIDVNRDGLLDFVTSNKKGVFVHLQKRE